MGRRYIHGSFDEDPSDAWGIDSRDAYDRAADEEYDRRQRRATEPAPPDEDERDAALLPTPPAPATPRKNHIRW